MATDIVGTNNVKTGEVLPATNKKPRDEPELIEKVLNKYLAALDDYRQAYLVAVPEVQKLHQKEMNKAIKKLGTFAKDGEENTLIAKGPHALRELIDTIAELNRLGESRTPHAVQRSLFIGLFTEYDSFIGNLMKAFYSQNEKLFKSISREIALSDLLEFANLDLVKQDMLEKEIDSFRRESYIVQFSKLESKFEIKTLRNFAEWHEFVELGQRRNLFTHNNGLVSQQYLAVCKNEGVVFENNYKTGDQLKLDDIYFFRAVFVLSKVGFMLAHTLWRKVIPEKISKANNAMNNAIYLLLRRKRWADAAEFGIFGLADPQLKNIEDMSKKVRIINTAIGLKMCGKVEEVEGLLSSTDWSACIREFKLAIAVLNEKYLEAGQIMREIGKQGELIEQLDYHTWPLFINFRDKQEFQDAYLSIYGVSFIDKVSEDMKQQIWKDVISKEDKTKKAKTKSKMTKKKIASKKPSKRQAS